MFSPIKLNILLGLIKIDKAVIPRIPKKEYATNNLRLTYCGTSVLTLNPGKGSLLLYAKNKPENPNNIKGINDHLAIFTSLFK